MRFLPIALIALFFACSESPSVVPKGDPSVSEELRNRKGETEVQIIKGNQRLEFHAGKRSGERPTSEHSQIVDVKSINTENDEVIIEGTLGGEEKIHTFEIIINQSKLIKQDRLDVSVGDVIEIESVVWKGKKRYYIYASVSKALIFTEWVNR